jgi:hypothetical protein
MKPLSFLLVRLLPIASIGGLSMPRVCGQQLSTPVYMQDTPSDTGIQPNPDTGPMWVSQDIWVRNSPDPGYVPYPFTEGSPPWTILPHQDPIYRDPLKSTPNYVYVEVRNHSATASLGTERLRLYWAKASTGLAWPTQWVDYQPGGPLTLLYGEEITKPRINGANATPAEQTAYVNAILAIGTTAAYTFPMGSGYWQTQQIEHMNMGYYSNIHNTLAFLPWHREFVNRYELLLRQYDPTVKLLYWDWTTNPSSPLSFMGSFGTQMTAGSIGAPFNPTSGPTLVPPPVTRGGNNYTAPPAEADSAVLARASYGPFSTSTPCPSPPSTAPFLAALENCSHDYSHEYIGGNSMSNPATAAQDPFFFMLHGNVDRLWAQWQRCGSTTPCSSSAQTLLDPTQTYGASSGDPNLTVTMAPWDGSPGSSTTPPSASNFQIQPWETTTPAPSGGNYVVVKLPDDPSVVSPPIYDVAPLTIPILQPGQAVVIQIPWYSPNPTDFSSFGTDQYHFCLLARIETSTTAPYGMTFPETSDVYKNTQNNNHIVWKNVTVVDAISGQMIRFPNLVRNVFALPVITSLRFAGVQTAAPLLNDGRMFIDLKPELFQRWRDGGSAGRGLRAADASQPTRLEIVDPNTFNLNVTLNPNEQFSPDLLFELVKDYPVRRGPPAEFDFIQAGAPGNQDAIVGGQRFVVDLSKLVLVKSGDQWRYWDKADKPERAWASLDFDDSKWKLGTAPLGLGDNPATTIDVGPPNHRHISAFFRHTFDVADPAFYRSALLRLMSADGAVVYLNGKEVDRVNLPTGGVKPNKLATRGLTGLARDVFFPIKIDLASLRQGKNVIAVEIHLNSKRSNGMRFDLQLSANNAETASPPEAAFVGLQDGAIFQTGDVVPVQIEALAGGGQIASVSLYVDGQLIGTAQRAPYTFNWPARPIGPHRMRAVAVDNNQVQATAYRTVTVVDQVLPHVELVMRRSSAEVKAGKRISFSAAASQRNGTIARVEFWVKDMATFTSPAMLIATVTTPPYTASTKDLKPGHYMFWAIAVNDRGGSTQSIPGHIMIKPK